MPVIQRIIIFSIYIYTTPYSLCMVVIGINLNFAT